MISQNYFRTTLRLRPHLGVAEMGAEKNVSGRAYGNALKRTLHVQLHYCLMAPQIQVAATCFAACLPHDKLCKKRVMQNTLGLVPKFGTGT